MKKRALKDILYAQVARIGKAASSPKRLEPIELLAQGEKSVEAIAQELSIEIKLASAYLRVLKDASLLSPRKEGKFVFYSFSSPDVAALWVAMREVAQEHLVELREALDNMASVPDKLNTISRKLMAQARRGDIVVNDVRPRAEFDHANLPYARSMPLDEIVKRMAELPRRTEIVAYCRGPFCLFAAKLANCLTESLSGNPLGCH